ncbi:MAG TPA: transposase [Terracidiphilus sp.]|nr:transposase [Terracidiphilus sp.]
MPSRLQRFHHSEQAHFITFSCWHHRPNFADPATRPVFEVALERIRRAFLLRVYGYVVMPDHVHLLLSEPGRETLAVAIKSLKQGVSRRLIGDAPRFWQKRYYDFNVHNQQKFQEKLRYIHRNPVRKDLCARPEDWEWSSFRHYATGQEGIVEIESDWTANKRERAAGTLSALIHSPTQAKNA